MKDIIRSYFNFSRTERYGIMALGSVLIVLIIVRATMHLWVHPATDIAKDGQLQAAWETFKRNQPADTIKAKSDYQDAYDEGTTPLPEIINLNTADSATLVRLKGIGPVTAGKIVAYRSKHPFKSVDELEEVGSFSEAMMAMLKKHLMVK